MGSFMFQNIASMTSFTDHFFFFDSGLLKQMCVKPISKYFFD